MIRNLGLTISAFNAWVLVKSLETMDLRLRAQEANAAGRRTGSKRVPR